MYRAFVGRRYAWLHWRGIFSRHVAGIFEGPVHRVDARGVALSFCNRPGYVHAAHACWQSAQETNAQAAYV